MERITLIEGSRSSHVIEVAQPSAAPMRFAGHELQRYLEQATGARLPLMTDAHNRPAFRLVCVDAAHGELAGRGPDGYMIRCTRRGVELLGNSARAVLYAVYHFLEEHLGCAWGAPGDDTTPPCPTLKLTRFATAYGPPAFDMRKIVLFPYRRDLVRSLSLPQTDWLAKNRLNWAHPAPNGPGVWEAARSRELLVPEAVRRGLDLQVGGHAFNTWVPHDRYAADRPELFAVTADGSRTLEGGIDASLCLACPDVADVVAGNIVEWLDQNPEADIVDLWHNDSHTYCRCPECTPPDLSEADGQKAYTRAYIRFCNQVAERVAQRHARARLNLLAYFHTSALPPEAEPLHENIVVGFCLFPRPGQTTMRPLADSDQPNDARFREQLAGWRRFTDQVYVYEYYTIGADYRMWSMVSMIAADMRYFRDLGVTGISSDQWGPGWYPLNMHAYARLAWDPDLEPDALVADFCAKHYGAAAEAMNGYWGLLEEGLRESWATHEKPDWRDAQRRDRIAQALADADSPDVERRIRHAAEIHQLDID